MTSNTSSGGNHTAPQTNPKPELLRRIASAAVLAALALAAVIASPWSFVVLVIVAASLLLWEWGHATRHVAVDVITVTEILGVAAFAVAMAFARFDLALGFIVATAIIVAIVSAMRRQGRLALAGLFYVALPAAALIWLRNDPAFGLTAVLFILVVAWTTDTASYVGGRSLGGPKFAPTISPKKTWSGFLVGTATPMLVGVAFALYLSNTSVPALALVALGLAFACQMGDLLESAVKRSLGIKDMSQLIPGHGGFFDRIDSLLLAAVVAALIAMRHPASPGAGLLIW